MRLRARGETEHVALDEVIAKEAGLARFDREIPWRGHERGHEANGRPFEHRGCPHSPRNERIAAAGQSNDGHAQQPLRENRQSEKYARADGAAGDCRGLGGPTCDSQSSRIARLTQGTSATSCDAAWANAVGRIVVA